MKHILLVIAAFLGFQINAEPQKIVLIMFENTSYSQAMAMPFFSSFAHQGALLTDHHAVGHPSQPNYIALVAGSTMGVTSDNNVDLNSSNLADLIEAKGKSWKVYAENFPGKCYQGEHKGTYWRKHTPLISFTNISKNPSRCGNIVDGSTFAQDFKSGQLPTFSMFIPNINDDGHDTGPSYADNWFSQNFGPLLQDAQNMKNVLIIATFDEDDGSDGNNHIYTAMVGPDVIPGALIPAHYDHIDMLRTIEDLLQVGNLGRQDASRTAIQGFLK